MSIKELKNSLQRRRDFFISFEETFNDFFDKELEKFSIETKTKEKLKSLKTKLFNRIFISNKENTEDIYNIFYLLAKEGVDIRDLIQGVFTFSIKAFSEYLLKTKPSVKDVYFFSSLLNEYVSIIEKAYLDFAKVQEKEEAESLGTEREKHEEEYILNVLNRHIGETFTAISYYKEVPIIFKLKILKTTDKFIIADISKVNINISKLNGAIYLKIPFFDKPVKTKIVSVDFKRNILALENPRLADIPAENRKHVRVVLSEPTKVIVRKDSEETMGLIVDISAKGLKFYTGKLGSIKEGDNIQLSFKLDNHNILSSGIVKHISDTGRGYMVGVELKPDLKTETVISDFVMSRQFEILRELRI